MVNPPFQNGRFLFSFRDAKVKITCLAHVLSLLSESFVHAIDSFILSERQRPPPQNMRFGLLPFFLPWQIRIAT